MSDPELLQTYTRTRSQEAFTALVRRHVDLVYSAALRQVRSTQLAEDVAQSVFLDLARRAHELRPGQPLAPWLFVVTRRTAVDTIRSEARRQAREQTAAELDAMKTPSPTWLRVKDEIDESLASLGEAERAAILLRFFENKSFREVGASLGITEDTAQKRVSRALDRLRDLLVRRGIAVSSVALASDLSAQALQGAPAALVPSIVTAAAPIAAAASATTAATTTAFFSKALAASAVVGALGFVTYEAAAFAQQHDEFALQRVQIAHQREAVHALQRSQAKATARLRELRDHFAALPPPGESDPAVEAAIAAWLERVQRLKALVASHPDHAIPELEALAENDWFALAREVKLDTAAPSEILRELHEAARSAFGRLLVRALVQYADAHSGLLPTDPVQLAPLVPLRLPPNFLARFEMLRSGRIDAAPPKAWLLAERPALARDNQRLCVGHHQSTLEALTSQP
ncbi:MAG TPA: sigma-70 family RNA polymerase sigma factor [Opitutaceae bacterium]